MRWQKLGDNWILPKMTSMGFFNEMFKYYPTECFKALHFVWGKNAVKSGYVKAELCSH